MTSESQYVLAVGIGAGTCLFFLCLLVAAFKTDVEDERKWVKRSAWGIMILFATLFTVALFNVIGTLLRSAG